MIRKATQKDIDAVAMLYNKAIDYEDTHKKYTSWKKGIYPTADTARLGVKNNSLYVFEEDEKILGSVILDNRQPPEYKKASWNTCASNNEVLVIHTLCVDHENARIGIGTAIIEFAKKLAKESGCLTIRLNTTATNTHARQFYEKNGFSIASTQNILLNGQITCGEHLFMEFNVKK